jgi:hypothetical protein
VRNSPPRSQFAAPVMDTAESSHIETGIENAATARHVKWIV